VKAAVDDAGLQLELAYDFAELARIRPVTRRWLDALGASDGVRYAVDLVVEEIVTNLIKYGDAPVQPIVVEFDVRDRQVVVRFTDAGRSFDPRDVPTPVLSDRVERRRAGGLGLHLVRQVAVIDDYRAEDDGNVLELRVLESLGEPPAR
jgi:anti-sigma regulatory factor (Ser/Thr protein kinase)